MKKKIYNFFENSKKARKMAQEITDAFVEEANKDNIEYSFDIAQGTGKIKSRKSNTSFVFDTHPKTTLHKFKLALFAKDLENITEEEEKILVKDGRKFLDEIKEIMNKESIDVIKDTLRRIVLPKSREEDIPLQEIKIEEIDIIDYSSIPDPAKYLLKIGKKPDTDIDTQKITIYVHSCQEKSGISVEEVYESEKDLDLFENVISLEQGKKYVYDVSVLLFVDYSLSKMPPRDI